MDFRGFAAAAPGPILDQSFGILAKVIARMAMKERGEVGDCLGE